MFNVYIIYRDMFDPQGQVHTIGGIESYILNLTAACSEQGWHCHIVQPAKQRFCVEKEDYTVHGVSTGLYRGNLKKRALAKWVRKHANKNTDIVIFATDSYTVHMPGYKTIAIQHGVSWDKPRKEISKRRQFFGSLANHRKYLSYVSADTKLVCVDHNFVNWYRTWLNADSQQMKVIYNCYKEKINNDELAIKWSDKQAPLKILIARRFVDYRGIGLIAPIIKDALATQNIEVTFAGEGPLKPYLENMFAHEPRVRLIQYKPHESFAVHKEHHIAIIPTLGSEGTSLSMIEAMAAGCMVICTNVGGLSNLIIHQFNGRITMPNTNDLSQALADSLADHSKTKSLAYNGLRSIEHTCSEATWRQEWVDTICEMTYGNTAL